MQWWQNDKLLTVFAIIVSPWGLWTDFCSCFSGGSIAVERRSLALHLWGVKKTSQGSTTDIYNFLADFMTVAFTNLDFFNNFHFYKTAFYYKSYRLTMLMWLSASQHGDLKKKKIHDEKVNFGFSSEIFFSVKYFLNFKWISRWKKKLGFNLPPPCCDKSGKGERENPAALKKNTIILVTFSHF